ncbi:MAG TPA: succinate dehydrogenase cytochrome b subunit [Aeromicrobium sp.]|nr:succinate dehydrogenase cytochrome b subunit [Aeromicrobium sp.]
MATTNTSRPSRVQPQSAWTSTVAKKYAMAVSGLIMVGYLVLHMYGNLKAFDSAEAFNEYAHHLREFGEPMLPHEGLLWIVRVVLLVSVLVHAYCAVTLWMRNKKASGAHGVKRYQTKQNPRGNQRSYASFTMRWGGVTIALFIVFHILNLTTNDIHPGGASDDPFTKLHNTFDGSGVDIHFWVLLFYTLAMIAVGFHLWHGFWSALTTLGQNRSARRVESSANTVAIVIAVVITIGFLAVPFSIFFFNYGG